MIQSIVNFCIREWLLVILVAMLVAAAGWFATNSVPLDAIPNVGDNQVIVLADWPGQSPKDVEDQLTYPLSVALQAVPGARSVRGKSMFGFSFVQVTFDDHTDFYWARSRVAEQLLSLPTGKIPKGVTPVLGPDATGLGQIFYYVLDPPPGIDLAELRSKQDYVIKLALESVDGVAEVASIGGYVRQYQVEVDPDLLRYHRIPLQKLLDSVRAANAEVGAKTVETSGMEYLVRGKGFLGSGKTDEETIAQIGNTVVQTQGGVPIRVRDLATVQTGPAFRQGALDLNGSEAVGGVVVMRYRENPRKVIQNVKAKIASLEPELDGIKIRGIYDRTFLINETVHTLNEALLQEVFVTILIVVLFLLHFRASLIIAISLPLAVLMAFIAMKVFNVDANIMSLAGIAIAIGTMVDMGIIILENIYDHLSDWEGQEESAARRIACRCDPPCGDGSGSGSCYGGQHNRGQFLASIFSDRAGPTFVFSPGLDENLCHCCQPDRGNYSGAGAVSAVFEKRPDTGQGGRSRIACDVHSGRLVVPLRMGTSPGGRDHSRYPVFGQTVSRVGADCNRAHSRALVDRGQRHSGIWIWLVDFAGTHSAG